MFLDVALNAGSYGLKGDPIGLTSVLTNLPTEFQGVLLAKIEMERHYAYRQLMRAGSNWFSGDPTTLHAETGIVAIRNFIPSLWAWR